MTSPRRWFDSLPIERQVLVLALVLDPIGFAVGYLLGPSFGVDPIIEVTRLKPRPEGRGYSRQFLHNPPPMALPDI
ncbi:hypothetical protein ACFQEU_13035, partial [Halorubrum tibetense]